LIAEAATFGRASFTILRSYVALTKPAVISLLLVTTVPAMVVADDGWPSTALVIATLIGGALSAGGANAINCWYDRDIDSLMWRTRNRPLVRGAVPPSHALTLGIVLGSTAFVLLALAATLTAALLSLAALLFYVFIYTIWLKRRTAQNIVVGGAAGAFPPVVGWAAVTGDVSVDSALMFLIIFLWTPPHFWALSLRLKDEYSLASVPMLPVTSGAVATARQILVYTVALIAASYLLVPFGGLGWLYTTAATALGACFVFGAVRVVCHPEIEAIGLYKYSMLYLALLFAAMGLDAALAS